VDKTNKGLKLLRGTGSGVNATLQWQLVAFCDLSFIFLKIVATLKEQGCP